MSADERMTTFIGSLDTGNTPFLDALEEEALKDGVPIIRPDTQGFLKFLLALRRPKRILEVGCAVGFSALLMSTYAPAGSHVTTIENNGRRIAAARANLKRAGKKEAVTLLEGDAQDILPTLHEGYDFIFMDAAKGQYLNFLPEVLRLLEPGGVFLSDNVLQGGDVLESRYAVARRSRTTHSRMREYLYELKHHPDLVSAVLPVGDGVAVCVKRGV